LLRTRENDFKETIAQVLVPVPPSVLLRTRENDFKETIAQVLVPVPIGGNFRYISLAQNKRE
jgi:hypothetical protein